MQALWIMAVAFCLILLSIFGFIRFATSKGVVDVSCSRSSHKGHIPRGAGVVLLIVWLLSSYIATYFYNFNSLLLVKISPCLIVIMLLGLIDDIKSLSVKNRFLVQVGCAVYYVFMLDFPSSIILGDFIILNLAWYMTPLLILGITWSINLFNFMDGIDGIAAVQTIFFFTVGGFLHCYVGAYDWAVFSFLLVSVMLGFLCFNWPPSKVFMGDSGSYFLGLLIAVYSLTSTLYEQIPLMVWMILHSVFWFDATMTLLRRIIAKEAWLRPHCSHAYQRLQKSGWGHRKTLYGVLALNSVLSIIAMVGCIHRKVEWAFFIALVILVAVYYYIEQVSSMFPVVVKKEKI